jgi:polyhydroxybutyrate depolymerase
VCWSIGAQALLWRAVTQAILRAGALLLVALVLGCSSSSKPTGAAQSPDASTGGTDAAGSADVSSPSDAGPSDASSLDAAAIVAARPYQLHVPSGYSASQATPLLVMFHGYGASGSLEEAYMQLTQTSDAHGFLYAYSDGTVDQPPDGAPGNRFWNATNACCNFYDSGVNDVQYFDAIVADVQSKYNVDPKRIFVVGHSNGGFMSHRLACDRTSTVAAIFSLAGAQWYDLGRCTPSGTVSVAEIHGNADETIFYDGGATQSGTYPSAPTTVTDWGSRNGCTGALTPTGQMLDLVADIPDAETEVSGFEGCPSGIDVQLWTMQGGDHEPIFNQPQWGEFVWGFLSAHPKP